MREQLYALLLLQEIDGEILNEEKKQKRLPVRIHETKNLIQSIEQKYQGKKESLRKLQLKIKRRDMDAKAIEGKIEKHQNELYGGKISDIKELKQLQKVIETLKKERDIVEEDLLVLMDEEDNLKIDLSEIEKERLQASNLLELRKKEVNQQEKVIKEYIEKKSKEREEISSQINDARLIERYNMLWNEKDGQVVVEVDGSICSGCNLSLPSDIIYHLQREGLLITCPNCNRILLWKEKS